MSKKILFVGLLAPLFLLSCGTKKVDMEKIFFRVSGCEGACPEYALLLHSNKTAELHSMPASGNDSARLGYFTGTINDSLYNKLNGFIQAAGIDSLTYTNRGGLGVYDGIRYTIIIYYNRKKKVLMAGYIPNDEQKKLIDILYEICKSSDLQRTSKLNIEGDANIN